MNRLAQNEGSHRGETKSNPCEQEIINPLLKMIHDVCNSTSYQIESNTTLDYDDEEQFGDFEVDDTDYVDESIDPGFDEQYIARRRHHSKEHGTKREKLQIIDDFVYDMFEEARDNILPVHDNDLTRWAIQRKITKLVARHHAEDTNAIIESTYSFVRDAKREMQNYACEEVLNTDHVGLESDLHSSRNIAYEEENVTMATPGNSLGKDVSGHPSNPATARNITTDFESVPEISDSGKAKGISTLLQVIFVGITLAVLVIAVACPIIYFTST
ncbi:unnamed protein product, partial [Rotaria magnacalcarata]